MASTESQSLNVLGNQTTPNSVQNMSLKDLSIQMANENVANNPQRVSPVPVDATDIGTSPVNIPAPSVETSPLQSTLDSIREQALAIQGTLDNRITNEKVASGELQPDQAETFAQPTQLSPRDLVQQRMMGLFQEGQLFDEGAIKEEAGVYDQQLVVNQLSQEYDSAMTNQRRTMQEMRTNPEGKSMGAMEAGVQNYKYESDQNLADKAMQLHYARKDFTAMETVANDAIAAEQQRYDRQMSFFSNMYDMLGNDLTDSEKLKYQSDLSMMENNVKALGEAKQEAVRMAISNGADADVVAAIKNAQTAEEVWNQAGSFGIDQMDVLNRQLLQSKISDAALSRKNTLWSMAMEGSTEAINQLGYDPRMIVDNTPLTQEQMDMNNDAHAKNKRDQNRVATMFINDRGLDALTGAVTIPALGGFFAGGERELGEFNLGAQLPIVSNILGSKESIEAARSLTTDLAYVTKNLTIDKFLELKAQGATFGAMSEGEWTIIGGAASELDNMIVWEDETKTKIKQINGTPAEVKEQLQVINEQYKKAQTRLDRELLNKKENDEIEENW